jgi:uncharacterized protein YegP (UPF0339 family)
MDYQFDFFEGRDGQTYVNIKHVNGQTLYTSEGYTREESAVDTLENFIEAVMHVGRLHPELRAADLIAQRTIGSLFCGSTEVQS